MAKRKVTFTMDPATVDLIREAAKRERVNMGQWLDRVARREAVRSGVTSTRAAVQRDAELDEAERTAAEKDSRAQG